MNNALVKAVNVKKYFSVDGGVISRKNSKVHAVDDVSFEIYERETLALVGESGCGKSTLGRALIRLLDITEGEVYFENQNIFKLKAAEMRKLRKQMQIIFQDPYASLNPRMTVLNIVGEPLVCNKIATGKKLRDRVTELIELVGLDSRHLERYPHAFSGGQRQRIGIARALATNPKFIVCDEAVSALDVSVQAQILNLLQELQQKLKLSYLFISHDLGVIQHISQRVGVMYVGRMVEVASSINLFSKPLHPYTEALLSAKPIPDPRNKSKRIILPGEVANPAKPPSGCYFHPRCKYAKERCKTEAPLLRELGKDRFVACHEAEELSLNGVLKR